MATSSTSPPARPSPSTSQAVATPRPRIKLAFIALAVLSGTLWFLSCADFDVWPFAWFAMVPTLYVTERASTTRQAFFYAWITGVIGNGGGFYWIIGLLTRFGHMPWIAGAAIFALLAAYQGVVFGAFGAVTRSIRVHTRLPMALVAALVMVTFELLLPMIFPFSVAITQAWQPHVIQIAELGGPLAVSGLLLCVNGGIYDAVIERRWVPTAVAAGVLFAALAYGHVRIGQVERARAAAPQLSIGVVQPNVSFDQKGRNRSRFAWGQLANLQEQSQLLEHEGPIDLLVWPETAYPYLLSHRIPRDLDEGTPRRMRSGFVAPLLTGAVTAEDRGDHQFTLYNTALLYDRNGEITGRFDKMYLMLFGEYTPGRDSIPIIGRLLPSTTGQLTPGRAVTTMPLHTADGRDFKIGPMICYEDIVTGFGRDLAVLHPDLLVNITNDSWFGDTSEPWEHLALSVFRAVEMRTDLVRAVNTGVSAFVDATGRVVSRTYAVNPAVNPRGADHLRGRVAMISGGYSVFARVGNVFAYLCALATVFLWLVRPRLLRRRGS